jgi:hypothetical protein
MRFANRAYVGRSESVSSDGGGTTAQGNEADNNLNQSIEPSQARPVAVGTAEAVLDGKKIGGTYEIQEREGGKILGLVIDGAKSIQEFAVLGAIATKEFVGKIFGKPAAAVAVMGLTAKLASGAEILNPSDLPASYNLGANTPGIVYFLGAYNENGSIVNYNWTGVVIGEQVSPQANVLQTFIATPMHPFASLPGESVIGAGTGNYITQNGATLANLTPVYESPLFNANNPWGNAGDVSVWSTTTALSPSSIRAFASPGSLQIGGTVTIAGYGGPSTPNGILSPTGNPMAFDAYISSSVSGNVEAGGDFFSGLMDPGLDVSMNGAGNPGESGAIALNQSGQILGDVVSSTGALTDLDRATDIENWSMPDFSSQLAPYEGIQTVPEPGAISNLATATVAGLLTRRRRR